MAFPFLAHPMKTTVRLLLTALGLAAASTANAQLPGDTYTPNNTNNTITATAIGGASNGYVQTMRFASAAPLGTDTFSSVQIFFTSEGGNPVTGVNNIDVYFSEWTPSVAGQANRTLGNIIGPALFSQSISLGAYGLSTFATVNPGVLIDPSKVYALTFVTVNTSSGFRVASDTLGSTNATTGVGSTNFFVEGRSFVSDNDGIATFGDLVASDFTVFGQDLLFRNLILTPVPETGTVAVAFAGVLVAGLAVRRRMAAKSKTVATVA